DCGESLHESSEVLDYGTKTYAGFYFARGPRRRDEGGRRRARGAPAPGRATPWRVARGCGASGDRRRQARPPRAARDAHPPRRHARDGLPRPGASRHRARRRLARRRDAHAAGRARARRRGAGAVAREALVHEPRLRARTRGVHDLGAARRLCRGARPRCVRDEPATRAAAARRTRARRRPPGTRPNGRRPPAPFRLAAAPARVAGRVRGAQAAAVGASNPGDSPRGVSWGLSPVFELRSGFDPGTVPTTWL